MVVHSQVRGRTATGADGARHRGRSIEIVFRFDGAEVRCADYLKEFLEPLGVSQVEAATTRLGTYNIDPRSANLNSELMLVCRGQKELAAEVLASIAAREAVSRRVIERGTLVDRSALLGESPLTQRLRFLFEMPIANLFDFLL